MSLRSTIQSSWNSRGYSGYKLPYTPAGPKAAYSAARNPANESMQRLLGQVPRLANPGRKGLLRHMGQGIGEFMGVSETGLGYVVKTVPGARTAVKYGGGLFTAGGWREITHDVAAHAVVPGMMKIGARRSIAGMLKRGAFKAIGPAFFIHQAMTEGLGTAVRDNVMFGAAWGAGKWALGRLGMAAFNPITIGAAVLTAGVIGGRATLIAGRQYNRDIRAVSFGNVNHDTYGNIATMRQASVNAIQSSKVNGRNALGNEASLMHI